MLIIDLILEHALLIGKFHGEVRNMVESLPSIGIAFRNLLCHLQHAAHYHLDLQSYKLSAMLIYAKPYFLLIRNTISYYLRYSFHTFDNKHGLSHPGRAVHTP